MAIFNVNIEEKKVSLDFKIEGDFEFGCFCSKKKGVIFTVQQDDENPNLGCNILVYKLPSVRLEGKEMVKKIRVADDVIVTAFEVNKSCDYVAIALTDRTVFLYDLETFEVKKKFVAKGGRIYCLKFVENSLCVVNGGVLHEYNYLKNTELKRKCPNSQFFFYYVNKNRDLWLCNESSMKFVGKKAGSNKEISYTQLAGCGIGFTKNGLVATGDLAGNVFLWKRDSHIPIKKKFVGTMIRAICCKPSAESVQIGCFGGDCWNWNIEKDTVQRMFSTPHGITCMKWENGEEPKNFACATSGGFLLILESRKNEDFLRIKLSIQAHKPWTGQTDDRFGSINKYCEIWSLSFSPENDYIGTSSEDQTICIWNTTSGEKIHLLSGHEIAVTSIEWVKTSFGEIICSASDDRRVCVWKNNAKDTNDKTKWHFYHIFSTEKEGMYWHTLTYLCVIKEKNRLAVVTQNGYLLIYDLVKKDVIVKRKIHRGSVEGLTYDKKTDTLATISADCNIALFKLTGK